MIEDAENLSRYFPYYLTAERKDGLLAALNDLPNARYYTNIDDPEPLQGDGWSGFQVINFDNGSRDSIRGVVLTNSCDMASDNIRLTPPLVSFVPLISVANYERALLKSGIDKKRVESRLNEARKQKVTDLFYLPTGTNMEHEHFAYLSDVHTMTLRSFNAAKRERIFCLSDAGFYIFLFKLAVHFCRMHENIDRS